MSRVCCHYSTPWVESWLQNYIEKKKFFSKMGFRIVSFDDLNRVYDASNNFKRFETNFKATRLPKPKD